MRLTTGVRPPNPSGRDINVRWPEQVSIRDSHGGKDRDFWLIVLQAMGIFLLALIGGLAVIFSLWSLPAELWWAILSIAYFAVVLMSPALIAGAVARARCWEATFAGAVLFVLFAIVAVTAFDEFIWDWLDVWTRGFFFMKVPVVNGWTLAAIVLMGAGIFAFIARQYRLWLLASALDAGCWYAVGLTLRWTQPSLHFYMVLAVFDVALLYGVWHGIARLCKEIRWPFYGSLPQPEEEGKPRVHTEHHMVPHRTWPRGDTEEEPQPDNDMPTIASVRPRDNRKNSELVPTSLRVDEFCETLARGALLGLGFRELSGPLRCTGRLITSWNQWVELLHPLTVVNIYDRERSRIHPDFVDEEGHLDPIKVLDHLGLERYDYLL